jgi:hypothetical protein
MSKPVPNPLEGIDIVLISEGVLMETEQWLSACENCSENAAIALEYVLDALTGCDPMVTEYLMYRPARCPSCSSALGEKTLVVVS